MLKDFWMGTYEDNQAVMNELYPPEPEHTVQFDLLQFEDIPF